MKMAQQYGGWLLQKTCAATTVLPATECSATAQEPLDHDAIENEALPVSKTDWLIFAVTVVLVFKLVQTIFRQLCGRASLRRRSSQGEYVSRKQGVMDVGRQAARFIRSQRVGDLLNRGPIMLRKFTRFGKTGGGYPTMSPISTRKRKKSMKWEPSLAKAVMRRRKSAAGPALKSMEPPLSFLEAGWEDERQSSSYDSSLHSEIVLVLKTCRVFGYFEEPVFLEMCRTAQTVPLQKGEALFEAGDVDDSIFVVFKGALELSIREGGKNIPIRIINAGETAGSITSALDVFAGSPSTFKTVEAKSLVDNTFVLKLSMKDTLGIFDKYPNALKRVVRVILVRLQGVTLLLLYKYLGLTTELFLSPPAGLDSATAMDMCPSLDTAAIGPVEKAQQWVKRWAASIGAEEGYDYLIEHMAYRRYAPHTQLTRQRQRAQDCSVYLVVSGSLQACLKPVVGINQHEEPEDEVVMELGVGGSLGALCLVTGLRSFYGVRCGPTSTELVSWRVPSLESFIDRYPKALLSLAHSVIISLSPVVRQADFGVEWMQINAGKSLYRQDSKSDSIWIVLNGRVRSVRTAPDGKKHFIDEFGRGESVGELELLTATNRVTSVHTVRDTELAKLPGPLFDLLRQGHPKVTINFARHLGARLMNSFQSQGKMPRTSGESISTHKNLNTIAVVAVSEDVPLRTFCIQLTNALDRIGSALHLTHERVTKELGDEVFQGYQDYKLLSWLGEQEDRHRIVVYEADRGTTQWTHRCVRQADCILVLGLGDSEPRLGRVEQAVETITNRAQKELVLLHSAEVKPSRTAEWLNLRSWCTAHHHIRCSRAMLAGLESAQYGQPISVHSDISRLARRLTNTSVGLVLGGGGARGLSHLGVIRALKEAGVPIDMVGGTSIGALIGGVYCDETDENATIERVAEFAKKMTSVWATALDMTYPFMAMLKGTAFNNALRDVFEERKIEDLWLPFWCVTTDLTDSRMKIHRHGSMWRYIRASMTLVGYLPPLCDPQDGHLLVDGGYTNNLPADIMKETGAQSIIGVDVASKYSNDYMDYGEELSGWWVLWRRFNPFVSPVKVPDMAEIQTRLAYVTCVRQQEDVLSKLQFNFINPPVESFGTMQFGSFEQIYQVGYDFAKSIIEKWDQTGRLPAMLKEKEVAMLGLVANDGHEILPQDLPSVSEYVAPKL